MELILNTLSDGIVGLDLEGVAVIANAAAARMLGLPTEEILGNSYKRFFRLSRSADATATEDDPEILEAARHGATYRRADKHLNRPGGKSFPVEYVSTPIHEDKQVVGAVVTFRDMTERFLRLQNDQELETARRVQSHLYPEHAPDAPGFDIAGAVFSATQACGDYFDFVADGEDRFYVAVGDVAGHGLGPALHMVETRAYLRALLATSLAPAQALIELNRLLLDDILDESFVTLFLALIDVRDRTLVYSGAGHEARLMRGGQRVEVLPSAGLVLGVLPDMGFENIGPIALQQGDVVLIITDGFTEARSPKKKFFAWEGVHETVQRHRDLPAAELIKALHDEVCKFSGDQAQADDMTAIAIRVL